MSDVVTLSLRTAPRVSIDLEGLTADRCATLSEHEIAALPVWVGAQRATVGDFFTVRGERSPRLRIEGSVPQLDGLGAGSSGGELIVDGDAGRRAGAGMTGGRVHVGGHVGDDAGVGMAGGVLYVSGNAGDRLGGAVAGASKGMTGGEIVVTGSAGDDAAVRLRRGLVVVAGDCGNGGGRAMIAGTLVVLGRVGGSPGIGSKRGSIVTVGGVVVPPTYRYACTYRPPYVRFVLTYLHRRYDLPVDDRALAGLYRRHCGDAGGPGKGEILEWVAD